MKLTAEYLDNSKIGYTVSVDGRLTVGGYLDLEGCTGITKLPEGLTVGGYLDLEGCTGITALPEGLTVGGSLDLRGTGITALPEGLTVGGSLYLRGTGITALPEGLTVGGSLDLRGTGITALPEGLTVGGYLDLEGCTGITALPEGLTVGGSLYLRGTGITKLPEGLTVGGYLDLEGCTGITAPESIKRPSSTFSIDLKFSIECKFNLRGFSIADGVLARVLSVKGAVKKVRVVGRKEESYLVQDGSGNYAHGETIAQARQDLIYKVVAKFDGALPESATGKEWIGIYRAVTGACGAGVKHFVEQTGKSLDEAYTAKEISELVVGKFGAEKFAEKVRAAS